MKFKMTLLCVVLATMGTTYAQENSASRALHIDTPPVRTDAQGTAAAVLQNISPQPITAYGVRWLIGGTYSTETSQDFFPSVGLEEFVKAGVAKGIASKQPVGLDSLPPGKTITAHTSSGRPDEEVSVSVTAVIFADGTAVGDEDQIQEIFALRKVQTETLQRILAEASKLNRTNAKEFFGGLAKIPHPTGKATDPDSDWVQQMAEVQTRPDLPGQYRISPDQFIELLRSRTSAAETHSTRRIK